MGLTSETKRSIKKEMDQIEDLREKIYEFRKKHPTDEDVRHLEVDCKNLEKEIEEVREREKERLSEFKKERQEWLDKIDLLKQQKKDIENTQPQNNPEIKRRLLDKKKKILRLIKKARKTDEVERKVKYMRKIKAIFNEILIDDPEEEP